MYTSIQVEYITFNVYNLLIWTGHRCGRHCSKTDFCVNMVCWHYVIFCDDLMIKGTFDMAVSQTMLNQHQRNADSVGVVVLGTFITGACLIITTKGQL